MIDTEHNLKNLSVKIFSESIVKPDRQPLTSHRNKYATPTNKLAPECFKHIRKISIWSFNSFNLTARKGPQMLSGGAAGLVSSEILRKEHEEMRRREKHNRPLEGLY